MGLISQLLLLPLAPLRFTVWTAGKIAEEADGRMNSPQARMQRLRAIEDARARGDIDDEQAAGLEAQLIAQITGR